MDESQYFLFELWTELKTAKNTIWVLGAVAKNVSSSSGHEHLLCAQNSEGLEFWGLRTFQLHLKTGFRSF